MECAVAPLTPTQVSRAVGISVSYASQLLSGERSMSRSMALRIYHATGHKLGVIAEATDAEISVLDKFEPSSSEGVPA